MIFFKFCLNPQKAQDMSSKCFICDIHRDNFAKQNLSFSVHRNSEHNQWNYSYFLMGLLIKDVEEMNGVESYVLERYHNKEFSWIPIGRALSLQAYEVDEGVEELVEDIEERVEKLEEILEEIGISAEDLEAEE